MAGSEPVDDAPRERGDQGSHRRDHGHQGPDVPASHPELGSQVGGQDREHDGREGRGGHRPGEDDTQTEPAQVHATTVEQATAPAPNREWGEVAPRLKGA